MKRKPYVQFTGWARVGAALSRLIDRWDNRRRPIRVLVYGDPQYGATRLARPLLPLDPFDLERGLWLEESDDKG